MFPYTMKRVGFAIFEAWAVSTLVFAFLHLLPGNPATIILAGTGAAVAPSPAQIAAMDKVLGLNLPIGTQYLHWMGGIVTFNLGHSYINGTTVASNIVQRLPLTIDLIVLATFLAIVIGMPLGLYAGATSGSWLDGFASVVVAFGISVPVYVVGTILILVFGVMLQLYPVGSYVPFGVNPLGFMRQLIFPAFALSLNLVGIVGRITRGSVVEVLHQDYVRTARAKGVARRVVMYRHVLRTSLIPIIAVVALQIGGLLGGTVLVEYIFNWPGISSLLYQSIQQRDYPVVQGVVLVLAFLFILINLVADLSYALADPRITYVSGEGA